MRLAISAAFLLHLLYLESLSKKHVAVNQGYFGCGDRRNDWSSGKIPALLYCRTGSSLSDLCVVGPLYCRYRARDGRVAGHHPLWYLVGHSLFSISGDALLFHFVHEANASTDCSCGVLVYFSRHSGEDVGILFSSIRQNNLPDDLICVAPMVKETEAFPAIVMSRVSAPISEASRGVYGSCDAKCVSQKLAVIPPYSSAPHFFVAGIKSFLMIHVGRDR